MGFRRGRLGYNELYFDLLVHRLFSTGDVSPFLGGGIGVHRFWAENQEDDHGPAMVVNGGVILFRTQYFRVTGVARGSVLFTERKGIVPMGGIHFGLTTPTYGSGSSTDVPSPCIYGCLGAFFLVGLVVTLFVQS
jgi:hypothetical protein